MANKVAIIMGSDSDLSIMKDAAEILDSFGISYKLTIISAHRTPDRLYEFAKSAKIDGFSVIIAGAGGAAHLPGMIASLTSLPVIGVPIKSKTMKGLDSLYSIVQMPPGIPVATMAINGAANAGILAAKIIGIEDETVSEKVIKYMNDLKDMVEVKADKLENIGYERYLKEN